MRDVLELGPVTFDEAVAAAEDRDAVLPDVYYDELIDIERTKAFSVAGISALDQLQGVLDSLTEAIADGMTFDEWKESIADTAEEVASLPEYRLDNIFRTNVQTAYARGKCVHIDEHKDERPYLMYSAVNDSRTRPSHAAMHGHVAPVDDSVWDTWRPPNGYRCRCDVVSLTEDMAKEYMKRDEHRKKSRRVAEARSKAIASGPDEGWAMSPCETARDQIERDKNDYHPALRKFVK